MAVQILSYPQYAYNKNTYAARRITTLAYIRALAAYPQCRKQLIECRSIASKADPYDIGADEQTNAVCVLALEYCFYDMQIAPYQSNNFNYYDIARTSHQSQWSRYATGYLNQAIIQQALGVPLNFTDNSDFVSRAFEATGDGMRGGYLEKYAYLLDSGITVAFVYGDRDYQCNWLGGEQVSLAIPYRAQKEFSKAGYTNFESDGATAGQVRQHGSLSFTRVYQAGHEGKSVSIMTIFRSDMTSAIRSTSTSV